jgi:DNA ligase-4
MQVQAESNQVTTDDIEKILITIASKNEFSSPAIRSFADEYIGEDINSLLSSLYTRLQSRDAKWLTRMILKDYSPVVVPETLVYRLYHHLLPSLLKVQAEFSAALQLLEQLPSNGLSSLSPSALEMDSVVTILPRVGVKVGRPPFLKGRSIKHCIDIARNRRMSVEKKYDGEYCQIHIDMSKGKGNRIQIFSKSGKDSTEDRAGIHMYVNILVKILLGLT